MNNRVLNMMRSFARQNSGQSISELSNEYSVSMRTIRNDINTINEFLDEHGLDMISYEAGGGLNIPKGFRDVLPLIRQSGSKDYRYSGEERRLVVSAMLVNENGYLSAEYLAKRLSVSRTTIVNDMELVKKGLEKGFLTLSGAFGKGFIVEGDEAERRSFLLQAINDLRETPGARELAMPRAFTSENLRWIGDIVSRNCRRCGIKMHDVIFQYITAYLVIAKMRIEFGKSLPNDTDHLFFEKGELVYGIAEDLMSAGVDFGSGEASYLAGILARYGIATIDIFQRRELRIQVACRRFIEEVSRTLGKDLTADYELFEFLTAHLESVFEDKGIELRDNIDVRKVAKGNPSVYAAVREGCATLEAAGERILTDVEKDYICLYVCAAIERRKRNGKNLRVILSCNANIGTSQLLQASLSSRFNFDIVDIIPAHEANLLDGSEADLVISTVPIPDCPVDTVVISAIPQDRDFDTISAKIAELSDLVWSRRGSSATELGGSLSSEPLVSRMSELLHEEIPDRYNQVMPKLVPLVKRFLESTDETTRSSDQPYLHQLLSKDHIALDVKCSDWRDAVRASGEVLVSQGYCEQRYIDAVIHNIEDIGPYIVISKGFALPHESADKGALKLGMNLIRLIEPVPFGAEELDPVRYVCMLSAVDNITHLRALFDLMSCLKNPVFIEMLDNAKTPEEATMAIMYVEFKEMR